MVALFPRPCRTASKCTSYATTCIGGNFMNFDVSEVKAYLLDLQDRLCSEFAELDGHAHFIKDHFSYGEGRGEGCTRVLQDGHVFEQAGVNFSHVFGQEMPAPATALRPQLAGRSFEALGVSVVMHPRNPFVPTSHANIRFFLATHPTEEPVWWFGGGYDLTPYYGFEEDCVHWHTVAKAACDPFGNTVYARFKQWCDEYFYLKHRQEPRGIGGLFFDDLNEWGFPRSFEFLRSVGDSYLRAYLPIVTRRRHTPYHETHVDFQQYRRGRYVEFNLLYDRGTIFGLHSGGRTESILMSLPPKVRWCYNWHPQPGTHEAQLYDVFLKSHEWVSLEASV